MPHAFADLTDTYQLPRAPRRPKAKSSNRDIQLLLTRLEDYQALYDRSQLAQTIKQQLHRMSKNPTRPITRVLSLGLGSLVASKGQSRRLKQLVILLALRDILRQQYGSSSIQVYAQDPTFTTADEAFLMRLDVRILRTPSGSELGEAESVISPSTLIYSPFLTLDAYERLLVNAGTLVQYLLGDDFNALFNKWPKRTEERAQVEHVMKTGLVAHRRRAIAGDGFWTDEDATFPMAAYERMDGKTVVKAKI